MVKKNSTYWKKRFEAIENSRYNESKDYYEDIQKQFRRSTNEIEMEIAKWYQRLADNNEISYAAAKRYLNKRDIAEFKWTVEEYIKYGRENALNQKWIKELENASARVHITKLEAIKIQMQQHVEELFVEYEGGVSDFLGNTYTSTYYRTAYEIAKGTGITKDLHMIDSSKINEFIKKPWAQDGKDFSSRIWNNKQHLVNNLHTELSQQLIRGADPQKAISSISHQMGVSKSQAGNLIMTESAAIASGAQKECLKDLGVEQYEILATLDTRTSEICRDLDGKVFALKDYVVGQTAPPFHCRCRTCTIPYFDDEFTEDDMRAFRDENGDTRYVKDMTYNEWHEEYVKSDSKYSFFEKKQKNVFADKKQYEGYRESLGAEYLPKSFEEFQDIKYQNGIEYGIIKAQAKGMTYYNKAVMNEPDITKTVEEISKTCGMNVLGIDFKIKSKESYLRKIATNYSPDGNEYEINDILRYTYGASVESLADKTIQSIDMYKDMGYNTIKVKNSWLNKDNPYNGINTIIQSSNGQKFELQYHTQESFDLKNGELHKLYEKQRVIEDKDSDEYNELGDRMFELSDKLTVPDHIERVN